MGDDAKGLILEILCEIAIGKPFRKSFFLMDFWKLGGHGALHQPFDQQGAIDFGLQQLGTPKRLLHLFRAHQKQASYS